MNDGGHELIVVGGGAAGMMAAISAARDGGGRPCVVERNQKVGRKLYITGKGRCNVTNHCPPEEVLASTPRNGRFLYGAVTRTPPAWVEDFFTGLGVPLKVERGNRVFPVSDRAADVIDALFFRYEKAECPGDRRPGPPRSDLEEGNGCPGWSTDLRLVSLPGCGPGHRRLRPIRPPALPATDMRWPAGLGPYCGPARSIPGPLGGRGGTAAEKCRAWR